MTGYVLAFDTATEHMAIALGTRQNASVTLLDTLDLFAPRAALGCLLPSVSDLLAAHSLGVGDLDAVVVGRGPGSFTGVRIAVATAKGLAHGAAVPLYGVSTLDAVAWNMTEHQGMVGIVGDAMRGEVYPALYRVAGGSVERLTRERVMKPADVAQEWAQLSEPLTIAGNALAKYADIFSEVGVLAKESLWPVRGRGVLAAYESAVLGGTEGGGEAGALLPVYTRLSDAEENERARTDSPNRNLPDTGVVGPKDGDR
ncbi:MAG: tRNA (adenosine(37)-N6)-threonylcarbamoyltransferase complex dimerization subunit type 1 TsaB [Coriobacteriia bacterium]